MLALLCSLSELMYIGRVACTGDLGGSEASPQSESSDG